MGSSTDTSRPETSSAPPDDTDAVSAPVRGGLFFGTSPHWSHYLYRVIAAEVSSATKYYDRVIQCEPLPHDSGYLLDRIDCPQSQVVSAPEDLPESSAETEERTSILLNGNLNYSLDIHDLLARIRTRGSRATRIHAVVYNPYLRVLYALATRLGLRRCAPPTTFVTRVGLDSTARGAGYEVVRHRSCGYFPFRFLGLGSLINRIMPAVPLLRWFGAVSVVTLKPHIRTEHRPSISVLVPARNERGNIEGVLERMPDLGGARIEVIFVEGNSEDGTWEEIQRVREKWSDRFSILALRQPGTGKNDAVRFGLSRARGELLAILDADLTMPPEMLHRFYEAWREGAGDFVNGSRLVYPMEGEAMRPLNHLANIFFAKALSRVLGVRIGDSLCGTKLFSRADYRRIVSWREDFGDFDPFGDFELLFPAAVLGLGIVDVPVRYRARTYGSTQISRFRHGLQLLRMTILGFFRVRLGAGA